MRVGKNVGFRTWFYFRNGWSTYFAFIFAAVNTLTVTYYLAIEKAPTLSIFFPSFIHYVIITTLIGIPLLVIVGYLHYKRTSARKAEVDIGYETNPYGARTMVNSEISLNINLELLTLLTSLLKGEKLSQEKIDRIQKMHERFVEFNNKRTFKNRMDLNFFVNADKKHDYDY